MANSMSNSIQKRSKGRRKVEMKKMSNESNLQVTFSKRRNGLFKKASELCILCGAEVALIVFSPADKAFSFGHPNVKAVIDRYEMRGPPYNQGTMHFIEAHRNSIVRELNALLTNINADLENEKKCSDELNEQCKMVREQCWWATPIQEMNNPAQLDQLKLALEDLKKSVIGHAEKQLPIQGGAANPPPQFFAGGSSSSNNPLLVSQVFPVHPPHQMFPVHPPHQMVQNPHLMLPNHLFDGAGMMHHPAFNNNNMGGYGPAGGFF